MRPVRVTEPLADRCGDQSARRTGWGNADVPSPAAVLLEVKQNRGQGKPDKYDKHGKYEARVAHRARSGTAVAAPVASWWSAARCT